MLEIGNIRLPIEILGKIFSLIRSTKCQLKLRQVCRDFKRIVDDGFYREGLGFFIRGDGGPNIEYCGIRIHPFSVVNVFKMRYLFVKNLVNKYKLDDLKFSHPNAVKDLTLYGVMRSENFSVIMNQLTNLPELKIYEHTFTYLRHFHLFNLKFDFLRILRLEIDINLYFHNRLKKMAFPEKMDKIQIFLTQNNFPRLKEVDLTFVFENIQGDVRITPKDDYQLRELILVPFLKNCQQSVEKIKLKTFFTTTNKILNFRPVEEDALNLETYKIKCPNLNKIIINIGLNNLKTAPLLAFLETNFEKLKKLEWWESRKENEAFYNLLKSQKSSTIQSLVWWTFSPYFADINFDFLKGFKSLNSLKINSDGIQTELDWTFVNWKLIPEYCPNLRRLDIEERYIDSDSVHFLMTENNLPKLYAVSISSKWRIGNSNGMRFDTFRKVNEEGKIEFLCLEDCLDRVSFVHQDNKEYLISNLGQTSAVYSKWSFNFYLSYE